MKLLVCGGRHYDNEDRVWQVLDDLKPTLVIHGGCTTGADQLASMWAKARGVPQSIYPPAWEKFGDSAGPRRNAWMIAFGKPDLVVAFPGGVGTSDLIDKAMAADISVQRIEDGDA